MRPRHLIFNSSFLFFYFLLFISLFLFSCSGKHEETDIVGAAAKQYYDYLLVGNYEAFVDGQYHRDSISPNYREQLIANAKMFIAQQRREHRGLYEVQVVKTSVNEKAHSADAFLVFVYGDSTREEVLVPMVEHKGLWYLK